jgi:TPR repeat protein
LRQLFSQAGLLFGSPANQFSEAIRRWNARDRRGAIVWGRRAAKHLPLAKVALAQWLVHRQTDDRVKAEAVALLKSAAEGGYPTAQRLLAIWYLNGTLIEKDVDKATHWLKQAAEAGDIQAQLDMVSVLTLGEYREPDPESALHYAELAAAAGHSEILAALVQDLNNEKRESGKSDRQDAER